MLERTTVSLLSLLLLLILVATELFESPSSSSSINKFSFVNAQENQQQLQHQQKRPRIDSSSHRATTKAIVFGATGAVGTEIVRALLVGDDNNESKNNYDERFVWSDILLIGRREVSIEPLLSSASSTQTKTPSVKQVIVSNPKDLKISMLPEEYRNINNADDDGSDSDVVVACFIAIGSSQPYLQTMKEWYDIDVDMIGSVAKLCDTLFGATYVSLLSSASETSVPPQPLTESELMDSSKLGWIRMIYHYFRMKAMSEQSVIDSGIQNVRIAQPSQIVTDQTRYGYVDRILFSILPYTDPYTYPKIWRSVKIRTLGTAIVRDVERSIMLVNDESNNDSNNNNNSQQNVVRLTFEDFQRIVHNDFDDGDVEGKKEKILTDHESGNTEQDL